MAREFKARSLCLLALVIVVGMGLMAGLPRLAGQESNVVPLYLANHELVLPKDFETWVFVGSNLGLVYRRDLPLTTAAEAARGDLRRFHNVYIDPSAFRHFRATRQFPEPTILVMDRYAALDREPRDFLAAGLFNGPRVGLEVAVKNSRRPDGAMTPWAYYDFTDPADGSKTKGSAQALADDQCESCHRQHAGQGNVRDNVWVQFYPVLRQFLP